MMILFTLLHTLVGDSILMRFIPERVSRAVKAMKKSDPVFAHTCATNGIAFIHSLIVVPIAIYCVFFDEAVVADPVSGDSQAFEKLSKSFRMYLHGREAAKEPHPLIAMSSSFDRLSLLAHVPF
eukprot:GHVU01018298.1.p2 GENE.GHVU01018298.1~~GHVU01018298.1.p2  ORF type:complete len:124 (+),score=12.12 GHVU01018298.1:174-545(+)